MNLSPLGPSDESGPSSDRSTRWLTPADDTEVRDDGQQDVRRNANPSREFFADLEDGRGRAFVSFLPPSAGPGIGDPANDLGHTPGRLLGKRSLYAMLRNNTCVTQ